MLKIFSDSFFFLLITPFLFSDSFYQSLYLLPFTLVASGLAPTPAASEATVEVACAILSRCLLNIKQELVHFLCGIWAKALQENTWFIFIPTVGMSFSLWDTWKIFKKFSWKFSFLNPSQTCCKIKCPKLILDYLWFIRCSARFSNMIIPSNYIGLPQACKSHLDVLKKF